MRTVAGVPDARPQLPERTTWTLGVWHEPESAFPPILTFAESAFGKGADDRFRPNADVPAAIFRGPGLGEFAAGAGPPRHRN